MTEPDPLPQQLKVHLKLLDIFGSIEVFWNALDLPVC